MRGRNQGRDIQTLFFVLVSKKEVIKILPCKEVYFLCLLALGSFPLDLTALGLFFALQVVVGAGAEVTTGGTGNTGFFGAFGIS